MRKIVPVLAVLALSACAAERNLAPQPQKSALLACYPQSHRCDKPLLFIDGKLATWDGSTDLDPAIIETVEVFKGTAALSRYGEDARNGVVLITTKKGRM